MENLKYKVENTGLSGDMGIELIYAKDGQAKGRMKIEDKHMNVNGTIHGGSFFTLADMIAGCAVCSIWDKIATVNSSIEFMRTSKKSEYITCVANVGKNGKNLIWTTAKIYDDNNLLLCEYKALYYRLEKE